MTFSDLYLTSKRHKLHPPIIQLNNLRGAIAAEPICICPMVVEGVIPCSVVTNLLNFELHTPLQRYGYKFNGCGYWAPNLT